MPRNRYVVFLLITLLGCALDLLTKHWIFAWRGMPHENPVWWLWEPYFGIETVINEGALFGIGRGMGKVFAVLSLLAALAIPVWLFRFGVASSAWLTVALSCILGGILGNLYDRLGLWIDPNDVVTYRHGVRDWILLRYRSYTWPNFNIADSLLVCGAAMLLVQSLWESRPVRTTDGTPAKPAAQ